MAKRGEIITQYGRPIGDRHRKIDLLELWYSEAFAFSSPLNPQGELFDRERIDGTYEILLKYFGRAFFLHKYGLDEPIADIHIVKRMLLNWRVPHCVLALMEIADLLVYVQEHFPALERSLRKQIKNADNFNSSLYEAYISRALQNSSLDYVNEATSHGAPLDGLLKFNGETFIVECKKLTAPNQPEYDCLRRIAEALFSRQIDVSLLDRYKLVVRAKRPAVKNILQRLNNLQTALNQECVDRAYRVDEILKFADEQVELIMIPFGCLDPGGTTDQGNLVVNYVLHGTDTGAYHGTKAVQIELGMSYSNEDVLKKIQSTIRGAKRQHRSRPSERIVIFIDSQELPDLQVAILQNNDMLNKVDLRKRIGDMLGDCVLVITRRMYSAQKSTVRVHSYYQTKDRAFSEAIVAGFNLAAAKIKLV